MAASVRVGVYNWLVIGLMAITFIVVAKILVTKMPVPGLKQVVESV